MDSNAVIVFVKNKLELTEKLAPLKNATGQDKLTWLAYPKAKQLNTDLNRDIIRGYLNQNSLDPVRQIAIDDTWSALRFKAI